jgi:tetratricopeptide (TPR) repeat protein
MIKHLSRVREFGAFRRAASSCGEMLLLLICTMALWCSVAAARPQNPAGSPPAQPTQPANDSSSRSSSSSSSSGGASAPRTEQYNPLPAEKDVEVATFYMRKGDPDASIPRLEEAIKMKPDYAKPRLMLGEIYEKKRDKNNALKYYREYLQVYPHAPDAKKVEGKIAKLSKS